VGEPIVTLEVGEGRKKEAEPVEERGAFLNGPIDIRAFHVAFSVCGWLANR
jgi:hypothetical protein